jgi:hypothetical protein
MKYLAMLGLVLMASAASEFAHAAEASYEIDMIGALPDYRETHLRIGGANSKNEKYGANEYFLTFDGRPIVPVTGEFHFWRVPRSEWKEQLLKLKAGGINIVATYVHWIVHEEREGVFNWEGYRDLRAFLEMCRDLDLKVILRVGPFGHGEVRNGGFPDWLMGKPLTVRSNDPEYLRFVDRFFREIGKQAKGLFFADAGPVIAVQIENEYQHSASPWGLTYPGQAYDWTAAPEDIATTLEGVGSAFGDKQSAAIGVAHMTKLLELIEQAGMSAPIYTATGWGNATLIPKVTLPVTGGYAYPGWVPKGTPSRLFLFTNLQRDPDYAPVSYAATEYPVISAEIGVGIQVTYTRRPLVLPQSTDAIVNRFLGSGANGIGYYMYQGGSSPRGERVFYSDEAYGYPKISYDFQAPIGEFGDLRPSFHRLKLIHAFLSAFGDRLAPLPVVLPKDASRQTPENVNRLRYAARGANGSGFLFINNFQDHARNFPLRGAFAVTTPNGPVRVPLAGELDVSAGESLILPINFDMDGLNLISATAQPLTKLQHPRALHYVFFGRGSDSIEYVFANDVKVRTSRDGCVAGETAGRTHVQCRGGTTTSFTLLRPNGAPIQVLTLDHEAALSSWTANIGGSNYLVLSTSTVLSDGNDLTLSNIGSPVMQLSIYPAFGGQIATSGLATVRSVKGRQGMSSYRVSLPTFASGSKGTWVAANKYAFDIDKRLLPDYVSNLWLELDYQADTVMLFENGELVADSFYYGRPWTLGLKKFLKDGGANLLFYFRPLEHGQSFMPDLLEAGVGNVEPGTRIISVSAAAVSPEYQAHLTFH